MLVGVWRKPAVVAVVMFLANANSASLAADANDLIAQGIKLRKDRRDQEALPLFQQAVQLQPTPRALGQLGTCEQALGLWVGAETHIQEALGHPQDTWVRANEGPLRTALAVIQRRLGSLDIWGSPSGARVSIDGEPTTTLPMSRATRVAVGQRTITIDAPGFLSESRSLEIHPGELLREHVALRSIAVQPTPSELPGMVAVGPSPHSTTAPTALAEPDSHPTPVRQDSPIYEKWWFWIVVGTVAVAAGTSAYFLANRNTGCQASMGGTCTTF